MTDCLKCHRKVGSHGNTPGSTDGYVFCFACFVPVKLSTIKKAKKKKASL